MSLAVLQGTANADHVVTLSVSPDGKSASCFWPGGRNPVGANLSTTHVNLQRDETGLIIGYTCHYRDLPEFIAGFDRMNPLGFPLRDYPDWHLPDKATMYAPIGCFGPNLGPGGWEFLYGRVGSAVSKITPRGNAKVTCTSRLIGGS